MSDELSLRETVRTLRQLELPTLVLGDSIVMPRQGEPWRNADGERACFFAPDGQPFPGDVLAQAVAFEDVIRSFSAELFMKTALRWRETVAIVYTSYLGANHEYFGGPPLIWETMISTPDAWQDFQHRYSTQNAAKAAHQSIVQAMVDAGMTLTTMPELEGEQP